MSSARENNITSTTNQELRLVLRRSLRKKCPQCGEGNIYARWNVLHARCLSCGCNLEQRAEDSWFFTYMSTAFLTGLIALWMLLFPVSNYILGYALVIVAWLTIIVLTLPYRKAMAIAFDYWFQHRNR